MKNNILLIKRINQLTRYFTINYIIFFFIYFTINFLIYQMIFYRIVLFSKNWLFEKLNNWLNFSRFMMQPKQ